MILAGRYEVERRIGRGGMSHVFLALDQRLNRRVAVKQLDLSLFPPAERPEMARQLLREARLLARLSHPGLVQVTDFFEEAGEPYLVAEYVDGRDLQSVIDTSPGWLEPELVLDWIGQVLDALEYLHARRVLFRDLKPANLMLDKHGRIRLIDFGIARVQLPGKGTTALLRGFGTSGYAPIEQYGAGTDVRSDLYSLGATLYALLTRRVPPDAVKLAAGEETLEPPSRIHPGLSPRLDAVVARLMATRKEARYQAAEQVRQALAAAPPAPVPPPVVFCPHRDSQPVVAAGRAAGARALTVAVYRGESREEAEQMVQQLRRPGVSARAYFTETYPGVVAGFWMVLVTRLCETHPGEG